MQSTSAANAACIVAAAIAAAGLAGCASKSGGTALFADDAGTASKALTDGKTLRTTSVTSSSARLDAAARTAGMQPASFAIKRNSRGGVDVTVNGETVSFAAADRVSTTRFRQQAGASDKNIYSVGRTLDFVLDEQSPSYSQLWGYLFANGPVAQAGFAVVGTETKPSALQGKATAEYRGYGFASSYEKDNPTRLGTLEAGTPEAQALAGPDTGLRMIADFNAATISGEITGLVNGQNALVPGRIVMEAAGISGNGYDGKLSAAGGFPTALGASATYSGRFYGTTGEETAGVLKIDTADAVTVGAFRARDASLPLP